MVGVWVGVGMWGICTRREEVGIGTGCGEREGGGAEATNIERKMQKVMLEAMRCVGVWGMEEGGGSSGTIRMRLQVKEKKKSKKKK